MEITNTPIADAQGSITITKADFNELYDALIEIKEFMDKNIDAEFDGEVWISNNEAQFSSHIEQILTNLDLAKLQSSK